MKEYQALSKYFIEGRGQVFCTKNDEARNKEAFKEMLGKEVIINGRIYKVKGVETYAVGFIKEGAPIGLLVDLN